MRQWNLVGLLLIFIFPLQAEKAPPGAAIASAHPMATQAGFEILDAGGNAFDAAVAVSAVLAVVEPYSSGLGGGGFWLLHRARDGHEVMIDGRETAPLAATRDMYLDSKGKVVPGLSVDGPLAAGIPGEPAALAHMGEKYGRLPLSRSLAPAIRAALNGFPVTPYYQKMAGFRLDALRASPAAARVFLLDNKVPPVGHVIRQPDLARTLEALAQQGRKGFYQGPLAKRLVAQVRKAGGIWRRADLAGYKVVERKPVTGHYRGYRITSAAPPSSGGIALLTMLNVLEAYPLDRLSPAKRTHFIVEAMRRAYRDRAEYLGDPDFVSLPVSRLLSQAYAERLRDSIDPDEATRSEDLKPVASHGSGFHTTHFSILDKQGNRVAATLSVNYPFGSGFMAAGTGVLLNDEMDDFSAKPGVPNVYGLVGAEANAIAPGKRMLSSMSPSFVESADRLAIIGTPGGSRIITMVLLGILDVSAGRSALDIVTARRFHHQYLPDAIQFEKGAFDEDTLAELQLMGHRLKPLDATYGNMQLILWERRKNRLTAATDPRGEGLAAVK